MALPCCGRNVLGLIWIAKYMWINILIINIQRKLLHQYKNESFDHMQLIAQLHNKLKFVSCLTNNKSSGQALSTTDCYTLHLLTRTCKDTTLVSFVSSYSWMWLYSTCLQCLLLSHGFSYIYGKSIIKIFTNCLILTEYNMTCGKGGKSHFLEFKDF